jgi:heme exporter protein B
MRAAAAIVRRDLRLELRTHEAVPAMALLALSIFVLLHFGLDRDRLDGDLAAGVLWMALLLATVLGTTRLYATESDGRLDGLLMAPIDRISLFAAKATVLFCFLVAVQLVAVPAFAVLLLAAPALEALPGLTLVLVAADACLAVIGALVSALAAAAGTRELLVPVVLLPMMVPVMIAGAAATEPLLTATGDPTASMHWLVILVLYGGVFGLVAFALFEELIEE